MLGPHLPHPGRGKHQEACLEALELSVEGNTADGKLSLKYNTCLGACSQAPVVSIDHRLHGRVTPETMQQHIERLLDGAAAG